MLFFLTLWSLAGSHGQLPQSIVITEEIEVSQRIQPSGWFADLRTGRYKGGLVAVNSLKVAPEDDPSTIRKVRAKNIHFGRDSEYYVSAFLSNGHSLGIPVPPKRPKTDWSSRRYGERTVHHSVGMDGSRERYGIHKETFRERARTGTCSPGPIYVSIADSSKSCTGRHRA